MKKVTLKINSYDMEVLIGFLEYELIELTDFGPHVSLDAKHLVASLTELYCKLQDAYNPLKPLYRLKIAVSQALALLRYSQRIGRSEHVTDGITFNKLLGIIDKQI